MAQGGTSDCVLARQSTRHTPGDELRFIKSWRTAPRPGATTVARHPQGPGGTVGEVAELAPASPRSRKPTSKQSISVLTAPAIAIDRFRRSRCAGFGDRHQ